MRRGSEKTIAPRIRISLCVQNAAVQIGSIGPALPQHACRCPQHLQPSTPSRLALNAADLPSRGGERTAECSRSTVIAHPTSGFSRSQKVNLITRQFGACLDGQRVSAIHAERAGSNWFATARTSTEPTRSARLDVQELASLGPCGRGRYQEAMQWVHQSLREQPRYQSRDRLESGPLRAAWPHGASAILAEPAA
jgi:hypothetical protein